MCTTSPALAVSSIFAENLTGFDWVKIRELKNNVVKVFLICIIFGAESKDLTGKAQFLFPLKINVLFSFQLCFQIL